MHVGIDNIVFNITNCIRIMFKTQSVTSRFEKSAVTTSCSSCTPLIRVRYPSLKCGGGKVLPLVETCFAHTGENAEKLFNQSQNVAAATDPRVSLLLSSSQDYSTNVYGRFVRLC